MPTCKTIQLPIAISLLFLSIAILLTPFDVGASTICYSECGSGIVACSGSVACCYDSMGCVSDSEVHWCSGFVGPLPLCGEPVT